MHCISTPVSLSLSLSIFLALRASDRLVAARRAAKRPFLQAVGRLFFGSVPLNGSAFLQMGRLLQITSTARNHALFLDLPPAPSTLITTLSTRPAILRRAGIVCEQARSQVSLLATRRSLRGVMLTNVAKNLPRCPPHQQGTLRAPSRGEGRCGNCFT